MDEDPEIKTVTFKDDGIEGVTVLKVMIKSKATKMLRIQVRLGVKDNESKNVELPTCALSESVFVNEDKHAFCFLKIDPSKDGWGELTMDVSSEVAATGTVTSSSATSTSMGTGSSFGLMSSYGGTGYSGSGIGGGIGGGMIGPMPQDRSHVSSYVPVGVQMTDDVKVACASCNEECDWGQDYCQRCGEPVTGYDDTNRMV